MLVLCFYQGILFTLRKITTRLQQNVVKFSFLPSSIEVLSCFCSSCVMVLHSQYFLIADYCILTQYISINTLVILCWLLKYGPAAVLGQGSPP